MHALAARLGHSARLSKSMLSEADSTRFLQPIFEVLGDLDDAIALAVRHHGVVALRPGMRDELQLLACIAGAPATPPAAVPRASSETPPKRKRLCLSALLPDDTKLPKDGEFMAVREISSAVAAAAPCSGCSTRRATSTRCRRYRRMRERAHERLAMVLEDVPAAVGRGSTNAYEIDVLEECHVDWVVAWGDPAMAHGRELRYEDLWFDFQQNFGKAATGSAAVLLMVLLSGRSWIWRAPPLLPAPGRRRKRIRSE